jgi:cytochrome b561
MTEEAPTSGSATGFVAWLRHVAAALQPQALNLRDVDLQRTGPASPRNRQQIWVRSREFLWNREMGLWAVEIALFAAYLSWHPQLPFFFRRSILLDAHTLPGIVILFSMTTTLIWSYLYMLIPIVGERQGFPGIGGSVFHFLFWVWAIVNFLTIFGYLWAISTPFAPNANEDFGYIQRLFEAALPGVGGFLEELHPLLFVGIFTAMDFAVALFFQDEGVRRRFSNVVIFIDLPILVSFSFIEFLLRPYLHGHFQIMEAGVVASQLIAGSLSAMGMSVLERLAEEASGAPPDPVVDAMDGVG